MYGKLRLKQEQILERNDIKSTILRVSNVFGYGSLIKVGNYGTIEKFIENIFSDKPIIVHGNGNHLIDYLCKDDLIYYLENLVDESPGEIYNISTGKSQKIINLAEIISNIGKNIYQNLECSGEFELIKISTELIDLKCEKSVPLRRCFEFASLLFHYFIKYFPL